MDYNIKKCRFCIHWKYKWIYNLFNWLSPFYGLCNLYNVNICEYDGCEKWKRKK